VLPEGRSFTFQNLEADLSDLVTYTRLPSDHENAYKLHFNIAHGHHCRDIYSAKIHKTPSNLTDFTRTTTPTELQLAGERRSRMYAEA
jgi:hypothetical protein